MQTDANDQRKLPDRRQADRRQRAAESLPFPDRRQTDRRNGADRRGR